MQANTTGPLLQLPQAVLDAMNEEIKGKYVYIVECSGTVCWVRDRRNRDKTFLLRKDCTIADLSEILESLPK